MNRLYLVDAQAHPALHPWLRATYDAYMAELVTFGADYERTASGWEPDYLPYWLKEPGCHPYVAHLEGEPVGFAFVGDREFPYRDFDSDFKIAEFSIVPEARGRGIGQALARTIFEEHPGRWELMVLQKNERALRFWRGLAPDRTEHPGDGMLTFVFHSVRGSQRR